LREFEADFIADDPEADCVLFESLYKDMMGEAIPFGEEMFFGFLDNKDEIMSNVFF
jgi:hypothetical protein